MCAHDDDFPDIERQFGTDPGEKSFNAITKEYKAWPTVENYVRLRRAFPDKEIEIATTDGIAFLSSEQTELLAIGIEPQLVAKAMDANEMAHAELSLKLMEIIIERNKLISDGETHVVSRRMGVSDTTINYLIAIMLDSISWNDEAQFSRELIVLLKHQLNVFSSKFETEQDTRGKQFAARIAAFQVIADGKKPTFREIGKKVGVNASTIMRWFPESDFGPDLLKLYFEIQELGKKLRDED